MGAGVRQHDAVVHPRELLAAEKRAVSRLNDWAATHLAAFFGLVWTVWFFIIWPLASLLLPKSLQSVAFFISSGWIQLWALPLLNYVGNRTQDLQSAQSDAQHVALTHLANTVDEIKAALAAGKDGAA
jgi:thiol:disulfide interchange protein